MSELPPNIDAEPDFASLDDNKVSRWLHLVEKAFRLYAQVDEINAQFPDYPPDAQINKPIVPEVALVNVGWAAICKFRADRLIRRADRIS